MPTSDEELQKKVAEVEKLRAQVAAAAEERVNKERELSNDVTAAALDREANTLRAQLEQLKAANKVSAVKAGAAAVLDPEGTAAANEAAKNQALVEAGALPAETVETKGR